MTDELKEANVTETSDTLGEAHPSSSLGDSGMLAMQGINESKEETQAESEILTNRLEQDAVKDKIGKNSIWDQESVKRGRDYETVKEANIAGNFPVIDNFDSETGTATSLKTIDLNAESYQNTDHLHAKVNEYTDKLSEFKGATWAGYEVPGEAIKKKVLEIGVPIDSVTEDQAKALLASDADAKIKDVHLVVEEVA